MQVTDKQLAYEFAHLLNKLEVRDKTDKQLAYEFAHLLNKLEVRDKPRFEELQSLTDVEPHPMFQVVTGEIATWEVL